MSDIDPVSASGGRIYGLGLLAPDPTKVCNRQKFSKAVTSAKLSAAEIQKLISDPSRVPASAVFDDHWVKEGNQLSHGSCNGWATASALSKTRFKRGINDGTVLSGSYVYSLLNGCQDNGSALSDDIDELAKNGAPPASVCGPDTIWRKDTIQFDDQDAKHKGLACFSVSDEATLQTAVALGFICVVAVQVDRSRFVNFSGPGILPAFHGSGNHAVHVDDLVVYQGQLCYRLVNNWGLGWGNSGTALVTFDSFSETIGVHQFWAITSTMES